MLRPRECVPLLSRSCEPQQNIRQLGFSGWWDVDLAAYLQYPELFSAFVASYIGLIAVILHQTIRFYKVYKNQQGVQICAIPCKRLSVEVDGSGEAITNLHSQIHHGASSLLNGQEAVSVEPKSESFAFKTPDGCTHSILVCVVHRASICPFTGCALMTCARSCKDSFLCIACALRNRLAHVFAE